MSTHIALLRAVNVGGTGKVAMADLRAMMAGIGFAGARTLLQSGNLVFDGGKASPEELEARLEREAKARLGLDTDFLVRTAAEWAALIKANPFPQMAKDDPGHLVVLFTKAPPEPGPVQAAAQGPEEVRVLGREVFVTYPDGIGTSKLKLPVRGTGRNWNTVLKLEAMTRPG